MAREIKYAELSQNQLDFLREYAPKDKSFTSSLEMKKIISKFGLDEGIDVEDMRAIRNSVVRFYFNLQRNLLIGGIENEKELDRSMEALQSVTAVIDHQMYIINSFKFI